MKVRELLEMVDETIAELKVALVANQSRAFETPYTSLEFTQRAIEIQEDLDDLIKVRERLSALDPDTEAEEYFGEEEIEKLKELLELLKESKSHVY
ncbi:hypothetical protein A3L09_07590 [Thermococcus profundus]|uniref:Uncharacterized protein n=1 Tax=Thermococcus profundus TaxID=49899 RepID=A0A2Z2MGS5_THEPR|nr:hypothetical protein [Thermococcus profundus]ASJ03124.1 hypothetical protein A3L09_07590 [Thermococcus profundus]